MFFCSHDLNFWIWTIGQNHAFNTICPRFILLISKWIIVFKYRRSKLIFTRAIFSLESQEHIKYLLVKSYEHLCHFKYTTRTWKRSELEFLSCTSKDKVKFLLYMCMCKLDPFHFPRVVVKPDHTILIVYCVLKIRIFWITPRNYVNKVNKKFQIFQPANGLGF